MRTRILQYFFVYKTVFLVAPLCASATCLFFIYNALYSVAITEVTVWLIDAFTIDANPKAGMKFIFLYVALYFVQRIFDVIYGIVVNAGIYEKVNAELKVRRSKIHAHMNLLDLEDAHAMDLLHKLDESIENEKLPSEFMAMNRMAGNLFGLVGVAMVLGRYDTILLMVVLISALPVLLLSWLDAKRAYEMQESLFAKQRERNAYWTLFIEKHSAQDLRANYIGNFLLGSWKRLNLETKEPVLAFHLKKNRRDFLCVIVKVSAYIACIALALLAITQQRIEVGVFAAVITSVAILQGQLEGIIFDLARIRELDFYMKDMKSMLDVGSQHSNPQQGVLEMKKCIRIRDVCFTYPNAKRPALNRISLDINSGERVVVVGENGSGKTTLSKVLLGLYPVKSGEIYYDDQRMEPGQLLYENLAVTGQNFPRYHLSLRENVCISDIERMGNTNEVFSALNATHFKVRKDGYDYDKILGAEFGGGDLSGGEWQKVALARVLFKRGNLIVLDEPTAQMDPQSEYKILKQILDITKEQTAIIISHRVGLCKYADKIVMLKNGSIVAIGSHDHLIENCPDYQYLYNEQAKWYA